MQWKFHVAKINNIEIVPSVLVSFWKVNIVSTMLCEISCTIPSQAYEQVLLYMHTVHVPC